MLTIAQFQANYYLPEGLPDRHGTQKRLDRLARHRLPSELTDRLRLPDADREAVYRIRHLHLDLWVDAQMKDGTREHPSALAALSSARRRD